MRAANERHCITREELKRAAQLVGVLALYPLAQVAEAYLPEPVWTALGVAAFLSMLGGGVAWLMTRR